MGGTLSNTLSWRNKDKEVKLLVVGMLPGAQYQLPVDQLKPMLKEKVAKRHELLETQVEAWSLGGRCSSRPIRTYYLSMADGVIFMLDDGEVNQKEEAKFYITQYLEDELYMVTKVPPFLFVVCKTGSGGHGEDVSDQDKAEELAEELGLKEVAKVPWNLVICDSETSESLSKGLGWLRGEIIKRKGGDEALQVMKSGKATLTGNHTSAFLQKMKHILSPA